MSGNIDEAERLPEGTEIDDYVFLLRTPDGREMKIYEDGQVHGGPEGYTIVINRLPAIAAEAAQLGYDEAVSRWTSHRRNRIMRLIGDFRK